MFLCFSAINSKTAGPFKNDIFINRLLLRHGGGGDGVYSLILYSCSHVNLVLAQENRFFCLFKSLLLVTGISPIIGFFLTNLKINVCKQNVAMITIAICFHLRILYITIHDLR